MMMYFYYDLFKKIVFYSFLFFVLGLLLGYTFAFLFFRFSKDGSKKEKQNINMEEFLLIFPVKYRQVINELIKNNYSMPQSLLRQKLEIDKVQMTRLMKRMEEEGFIKIKRGSKINYIELNENITKLVELIKQ